MRLLSAILLFAACAYGDEVITPIPSDPTFDTVQFDLLFEDGVEEGRLQWNNEDGVLEVGLPGGDVALQIGLESLFLAVNKTGSTISNGTPVFINGAQGGRPTIAPADADDDNANHVCGITTETIDNNRSGYVTTFGYVRDLDTSDWSAGDLLYLNTVSGGLTNGIPAYPAEPICAGVVVVSNPESGIVLSRPSHRVTFELLAETPLQVSTLELTDTNVYEDLRFPASTFGPASGRPDTVILSNCIYTLAFDENEYVYFIAQMSHTYRSGTDLEVHLHWISPALGASSTWELEYSKAPIHGVFSAPVTVTNTFVASGVAGTHEVSDFDEIPGFESGVSAIVGCKVTRLSGGTSSDIHATELDIHYKVQYIGGKDYH